MTIIKETKVTEFIEYDGIRFYRDKKGYWLSAKVGTKNYPKRLHVYVWEKHNGEIPKGYHIHHIDFDTNNNEINNLSILSSKEHLSLHGSIEKNKAIARKNVVKYAVPAAVEWHGTAEGNEWHKKHYQETKDKLHTKVEIKCLMCGENVVVSRGGGGNKFCSNKCKSKYRRESGIDNVESNCKFCGKEFVKGKYLKTVYCSKSCSSKANSKKTYPERIRNNNGQFV